MGGYMSEDTCLNMKPPINTDGHRWTRSLKSVFIGVHLWFRQIGLDKRYACLALALLIALTWGVMLAQGNEPVALRAEIDRNPITVGDPVVYTLHAEHPADVTVHLPNLPAAWDTIEVLGQQPEPTHVTTDKLVQTTKQYTMTAFSVGDHTIRPLPVEYFLPDGQKAALESAPITLTVQSVATDTSLLGQMDIRPLKPQAELPRPIVEEIAQGAGISLLPIVLILLALWLFVWRKRRAVNATEAAIDHRLPEEIAYEELEHIQSLPLPEHNRMKEYYTLVADCLRRYAGRSYGIPAMDQTTAEFTTAMRKAHVDREHVSLFGDLFSESDLVKFAKHAPDVAEANQAVQRARRAIDVTKPVRAPAESHERVGRVSIPDKAG